MGKELPSRNLQFLRGSLRMEDAPVVYRSSRISSNNFSRICCGKKLAHRMIFMCWYVMSPAMDWHPVQGVPRLVPDAPWDRLQVPRDPEKE
ncbi:hypothetical protein AMELA_G00210620 [Ameiurus melas]|uniref:Uncharacterized protein n=1 Tax=Ameiurus melas TaxID=219545 RepID=A0A7J6A472_AMEME|nr:hypothetical protein AMELA_G00210620 [Ameiurus melas]